MNAQALDLRAFVDAVRRRIRLVLLLGLLGAAVGAGIAAAQPPSYSSVAQVLLPPPARDANGSTTQRDIDTYVQVTSSQAVLGPAAKALDLTTSTRALARRLRVSAPTADVVKIVARAGVRRDAQSLAQATARSLVDYLAHPTSTTTGVRDNVLDQRVRTLQRTLGEVRTQLDATRARIRSRAPGTDPGSDPATLASLTAQQADLVLALSRATSDRDTALSGNNDAGDANSDNGSVDATLIQPGSPAVRYSLVQRYAAWTGGGLVVGLLLAALWVVVRTRRDRRLYTRDALADALGSPVVASLASSAPRTPGAWLDLIAVYDPPTVDAWAIRQAMHHTRSTVLVIALSDDVRGLALAPLVASFAAANATTTRLVPVQGHDSATSLWAACARAAIEGSPRPGLRVATTGPATGAGPQRTSEESLRVLVAVLDRHDPRLGPLVRAEAESTTRTTTLLALSAGSATLEELARVAVRADEAGLPIEGILLADPERLDHTTGRFAMSGRAQEVPLPIRLTGGATARRGVPTGDPGGLAAVRDHGVVDKREEWS